MLVYTHNKNTLQEHTRSTNVIIIMKAVDYTLGIYKI